MFFTHLCHWQLKEAVLPQDVMYFSHSHADCSSWTAFSFTLNQFARRFEKGPGRGWLFSNSANTVKETHLPGGVSHVCWGAILQAIYYYVLGYSFLVYQLQKFYWRSTIWDCLSIVSGFLQCVYEITRIDSLHFETLLLSPWKNLSSLNLESYKLRQP